MKHYDWRQFAIGVAIRPFLWRLGPSRYGDVYYLDVGPLTFCAYLSVKQ